jgi:D-sedoheptulose 7-phosphate isomerase
MKAFIQNYLRELDTCLVELDPQVIEQIKDAVLRAREADRQIFVIGNGGSASTASHLVCDWSKGVLGHTGQKTVKRFRVMSLVDNVAVTTAWANDTSYEDIFAQQLENLINEGDLLVAISASGNSPNLLAAVEVARKHHATVIGLVAFGGGKLAPLSDLCLTANTDKYDVAEDVHLIVSHMLTRWFFENLTA